MRHLLALRAYYRCPLIRRRFRYQSDTAAQFAAKQALAEFLADLLKEEKRSGK